MKLKKIEKVENIPRTDTGKKQTSPISQNTLRLIEDVLNSALPDRLVLIEQFLSTTQ